MVSPRTRPTDREAALAARSRLEALDGLRGLSAVAIIVLHVWMFVYGDAGRPAKNALDMAIGEFRLAVPLFFMLSGFLIYRPFVAAALDGRRMPRLRAYALRRAARILPAYWIAVLASFVAMREVGHPHQIDAGQLPVFLLFAQNYFAETAGKLDPPMWTLCVEVSFYAAVPLVGLLALRLGTSRVRQIALCLLLVLAGRAFGYIAHLESWQPTLTDTLLVHMGDFGAGMAVAVALHRRTIDRRAAWAMIASGVALILANGAWHALQVGDRELRYLVGDLPGVAGLALVITAYAGSTLRGRALAHGPARWAGTLSYAMYLAHYPVLIVLRETGNWPGTMLGSLAAVFAITWAIAAVSWVCVERPAIRWAQRRTAREARKPDAAPVERRPVQDGVRRGRRTHAGARAAATTAR